MSPLVFAVLGASAGIGIWVTVAALWPWRPSLAAEIAELEASLATSGEMTPSRYQSLRTGPIRLPKPVTPEDLACLDHTLTSFWIQVLRASAFAAAAGLAVALMLTVLETANPLVAILIPLAGAAVAIPVMAIDAQPRAEAVRREYQRALAILLDQIALDLAGGAGVNAAVDEAVEVGSGPEFAAIRDTLARAKLTHQTPWDALGELGRRIGAPDYRQLAATIALAGSEGARIKSALTARAAAMRAKATAIEQAEADQTTERMSVPVSTTAICTVLFVIVATAAQMLTGT
jgi:tight adherence protein C